MKVATDLDGAAGAATASTDGATPADAYAERLQEALLTVARVCEAAAVGDLEPRVPDLGDDPALTTVRHALNRMLDLTDAFVREAGASLQAAADGHFHRRFLVRGMAGSFRQGAETINRATHAMAATDARLRAEQQRRIELAAQLESAVLGVAEQVAGASTEMEATSRSLAETAQRNAQRADSVSSGAVEAEHAVTSVAAGVEELVSTVASIEEQTRASSQEGQAAMHEAQRVRDTAAELAVASKEIGQVVGVIEQVAYQTRLLALNATIEAARAGDAGKGFAVVAAEVKNLAAQTADATSRIEEQVRGIQSATSEVVQAIEGIGDTINRIGESLATVAVQVGEQRQATTEMSRNTQGAAAGVADVSEGVTEIDAGIRETSHAADELTQAALELSRLSATLRTEIDEFLADLA